jgi:hypothetical protein
MLTEEHDAFHVEKEEILKAALESCQIQTDDVGTRHKAKNCYTNVICGEFFVYLSTTNSKSRINFLTILAQGRNEYLFNQDSLDKIARLGNLIGERIRSVVTRNAVNDLAIVLNIAWLPSAYIPSNSLTL